MSGEDDVTIGEVSAGIAIGKAAWSALKSLRERLKASGNPELADSVGEVQSSLLELQGIHGELLLVHQDLRRRHSELEASLRAKREHFDYEDNVCRRKGGTDPAAYCPRCLDVDLKEVRMQDRGHVLGCPQCPLMVPTAAGRQAAIDRAATRQRVQGRRSTYLNMPDDS